MTPITDTLRSKLDQTQALMGIIGLAGLVIGAGIAFATGDRSQFFQSYLIGFFYWTGIALGCLVLFMLHHLVGGRWGFVIQRLMEAGMFTLPLMFVLFLPVLIFGMHDLYEWTHADVVAQDELLQHKEGYLNIPFFWIRTIFYFALWGGAALLMIKWSNTQDETGDPGLTDKIRMVSGPGIPIFGLTVTFASFDWLMSLDPHWFSTIYGIMQIVNLGGATLSFLVIAMRYLANHEPFSYLATSDRFHDWGKLMLAFTLLWFYIMLSQFLIIWSANLPEENPWYLHRVEGGWAWVSIILVLFRFVVAFFLLLSIPRKRDPRRLMRVAALIMGMHLVDLFWHIAPNFSDHGLQVSPLDVLLPVGIGGIWMAVFLRRLKSRPLIPQKDERFTAFVEESQRQKAKAA